MFYKIKIKLPKSKVKKFQTDLQKTTSQLNESELNVLLTSYDNHFSFIDSLNNLNLNGTPVVYDNFNQKQLNHIKQFYTTVDKSIANSDQEPGTNSTLTLDEFNNFKKTYNIKILRDIDTLRLQIINKFKQIGISIIFSTLRYNGINIYIPNREKVNKKYFGYVNFIVPDESTIPLILEDMIQKQIIKTPLSIINYNERIKYLLPGDVYKDNTFIPIKNEKPYHFYNNTYYYIPDVLQQSKAKFTELNQQIIDYITKQYVKIEKNITNEAFTSFLEKVKVEKESVSSDTYQNVYYKLPETKAKLSDEQTFRNARYYTFNNINYWIPEIHLVLRSPNLKPIYLEFTRDREPTNSKANIVFKKIEKNSIDLDLTPGLVFETEFLFNRDPRFKSFLEEYVDPKNPLNSLFMILKGHDNLRPAQDTIIENDTIKFNLSNTSFDPREHTKTFYDLKNNGHLHEFELTYRNGTYYLSTQIPTKDSTYETANQSEFNLNNINPNIYKFDAVIHNNNKILFIIEFDGIDHFRSYRSSSFELPRKVCSDQIKNAFSRKYPEIKMLRIPMYSSASEIRDFDSLLKEKIITEIQSYFGKYRFEERFTYNLQDPNVSNLLKT